MQDAIIVGAGIGGLAAAIRLAAAGRRVMVLEKNPAVGGKMNRIAADGFCWDTGPTVITMRPVLEDLFAAAGRSMNDYLALEPVDPLTRYFFADGAQLDATADPDRMAERIAPFDPRDAQGYRDFLAYAARLHHVTGPAFIHGEPVSWRTLLRVPLTDALSMDAWRTMDTAIRGFVRSPQIRQMLGRFATYVGASPFQAPATLNVIGHVELNGGVWYPRGGIYSIARALEKLARELGVDVRLGCAAEQIAVEGGRAKGVIAGGQLLPARAVVANLDVALVYERLLPAGAVPPARTRALALAEPSCSAFILLLGVDGQHPTLAHHNIFFSPDYAGEFRAIFDRGVMPDDPTIYLAITSKTDAAHAPPGCENWFVLVNAPALGPQWDWEKETSSYRDLVLERLAARGLELRDRIRVERRIAPPDLERLTGARRGALYGASSNSPWAAFRRPHNRCADLSGLYFAGGTAHPGGGVPMVMLSGRVAAQMVLADIDPANEC